MFYGLTSTLARCSAETGERLGRFVGIAEHHGDALTYWILTHNDKLLACSVVRTATATEPNNQTSTSAESKGSIEPMEPDTGRKGSTTLNLSPTALDLMSDLVGGSADFAKSKGSIEPMEPNMGRKGSTTLNLGPTALDLMSDLVGGSADFDPIPYLGYSFVCADAHDIPHKTMVITVDTETGRVLLE